MDKETVRAAAHDVYLQAAQGYEIALDPELADAMGAYVEDAIAEDDISNMEEVEYGE